MTLHLSWRRAQAFYAGAAVGDAPTSAAPTSRALWDVFLDGQGYMLDFTVANYATKYLTLQSLPMQRSQQTQADEPGEHTLSTEGLWRRSVSSWHHGAGQVAADRFGFDSQRFNTSRGVDVWTRYQLSLLPDVTQILAVTGSNTFACSTAGFVYFCDGSVLHRTDGTTTSTVTGTPGAAVSLCTVGSQVLTAHGAAGVYVTPAGTAAATQWLTGTVDAVGFAKGRVMAAAGPALYNPTTAYTSTSALPVVLFTQPDPGFRWAGFAEGPSHIYCAGNSGNVGYVYKTATKADGTALDIPTVAGRLPDGETITNIYGYLGTLVICTTRGWRFCVIASGGDLSIGRLVDLHGPVYGMAGWGPHIYFGWTNFDGSYTGVGRIDPTVIADTEGLVPAYASDLMAVGQGTVRGVAILNGSPVFGVDGLGFYGAHPTDRVPSGYVDSGQIGFGLPEDKVATGVETAWDGDGTVTTAVSYNRRAFQAIGVSGAQRRGVTHEVRLTLTRNTLRTGTPTLTRWTLFVIPTSTPTYVHDMAVHVTEEVECRDGVEQRMPVAKIRTRIKQMHRNQELVTFQDGATASTVVVQDFRFALDRESSLNTREWGGTLFLTLKEVG